MLGDRRCSSRRVPEFASDALFLPLHLREQLGLRPGAFRSLAAAAEQLQVLNVLRAATCHAETDATVREGGTQRPEKIGGVISSNSYRNVRPQSYSRSIPSSNVTCRLSATRDRREAAFPVVTEFFDELAAVDRAGAAAVRRVRASGGREAGGAAA